MARVTPSNQRNKHQAMCQLRHRYTEQLVVVPVTQYISACAGQYQNWCMAGQPSLLRPPVTISEMIADQMIPQPHAKRTM